MSPPCYTPSGRFSMRIIVSVVLMLIAVVILSSIYNAIVYINPFIYVNFLVLGAFCFGLVLIGSSLVEFGKSRNKTVSFLFGLLTGVTALYANWITFAHVLVTDSIGEVFDYEITTSPAWLWEVATEVAVTGWYSLFDIAVSGIVLWAFWTIEALGLLLAPLIGAYTTATTRVFCEKCDRWADQEDGIVNFTHPDAERVVSGFETQDVTILDNANIALPTDAGYFSIDAEWCKKCRTTMTLSLRAVTRQWDDKGKESENKETVCEDMLVEPEIFDRFFESQKSLASKATSAT